MEAKSREEKVIYQVPPLTNEMCVLSCLVISDSATLWTVAHQAPLSMGILQARILEWFAFPTSGDLPYLGIEPRSLASPALASGFFTTVPPGKPNK